MQCGRLRETACIASITAGAATNLAVVGVAAGAETDSVLDETGSYVGTSPIVIDSYIQTNSQDSSRPPIWTTILDGAECCDLQVWDAFTNVVDDTPEDIVCSTDSPYTTIELTVAM